MVRGWWWHQKHLCDFLKGPDPLPSSRGGAAGKRVLAKFHWLLDVCWRANYRYEVFARSVHSLYFAELEMTDRGVFYKTAVLRITSLSILGEDSTEQGVRRMLAPFITEVRVLNAPLLGTLLLLRSKARVFILSSFCS